MNWLKEFSAAVTVCDPDGIVLEMNDKAAKTFESDGGYGLVGANLKPSAAPSSRANSRFLVPTAPPCAASSRTGSISCSTSSIPNPVFHPGH
jgi:hypothetical protein